MTAHAKLSASGAQRWLNCPGSIVLESGMKESPSVYAQEGTLAHAVAEEKVKRRFELIPQNDYLKAMEKFRADEDWTQEMDHYTDEYVDQIWNWAMAFTGKPFTSVEERVDFSPWVPEGFGTCDFLALYGDTLRVVDLKYGKGVPVSPVDNPQLKLYGLGAFKAYKDFYEIEKIILCIVQPRLNSIEEWEISREDLLQWGESIRPIALEAYEGSSRLKEGEHCRFCKAKARCPERARTMFERVETLQEARKEPIETITNEAISHYLLNSKGIIDWIKDLEETALGEILAGRPVPGFKAVEGRSNRVFRNQDAALQALIESGYDEAILFEKKPISLSKLEKLVGKNEFYSILGDEILKPQGKPTLVEESDKRPPFVRDLGFEAID